MKDLSNILLEKLKINKNTEIIRKGNPDLKFPAHIQFAFLSDDIYRVRDYVHDNTNAIRFGISKLETKGNWTVYDIEVENREDFLHILVLCLKHINDFKDIPNSFSIRRDVTLGEFRTYLNNYTQIKDYIFDYTDEEILNAYNEEIK